MKNPDLVHFSRRDLIARVMPICAASCLLPGQLFGLAGIEEKELLQQTKHKFDKEMPFKITMRLWWASKARDAMGLIDSFIKEFGKDKVIEILKERAFERGKKNGKSYAEENGNTDFNIIKKMFIGPDAKYKDLITHTVTENTDRILEVKVTECLYAEPYVNADKGNIGNAYLCHGDFGFPEGFSPKLKLVRDKTLTLGHKYCNHRYIWSG